MNPAKQTFKKRNLIRTAAKRYKEKGIVSRELVSMKRGSRRRGETHNHGGIGLIFGSRVAEGADCSSRREGSSSSSGAELFPAGSIQLHRSGLEESDF